MAKTHKNLYPQVTDESDVGTRFCASAAYSPTPPYGTRFCASGVCTPGFCATGCTTDFCATGFCASEMPQPK